MRIMAVKLDKRVSKKKFWSVICRTESSLSQVYEEEYIIKANYRV